MNKFVKKFAQSLFDRHWRHLYQKHPLKWVEIEITRRCNLACLHCGSSCELKSSYKEEMSEEQIIAVFRRIAEVYDPGDIRVAITGGEPLMRKDLYRIMARINETGFRMSMVTNGYFIDEKAVKYLAATGLYSLSVSFDGVEKTHNWLRGRPDACSHAVNAMRLLKNSGLFYVEPLTTVNKHNLKELEMMEKILFDDIGVDSWRLFQTMPIGRARNISELLLNGEETRILLDFIKLRRKQGRPLSYGEEGWLGPEYEMEVRDYFHMCPAGVFLMSILADGSLIGCTAMDHTFIEGNVLRDDIIDVWENRFQRYRDREWMRSGVCANCKYFNHCQGDGMHLRHLGEQGPTRCVYDMINTTK